MINNLINNIELEQQSKIGFTAKLMEDIYDESKGQIDEPHRHEYYTIIWPQSNVKGKHIIDFNEFEIKKNGIFFIQPGQIHQLKTESQPKGIVILFNNEFLAKSKIEKSFIDNLKIFNSYLYNEPLFVKDFKAAKLNSIVESIIETAKSINQFTNEALGAYLKLFLIECTSVCDAEIQEDYNKSKQIMEDFKKLIEQNFKIEHKVQFYSDRLVISSGHLNHTIKNEIGLSAKEYIQNRIILEAKRLMLFSNKSAKQISFELGFTDPHHSSKFFKGKTGESITSFIKSNSKKGND